MRRGSSREAAELCRTAGVLLRMSVRACGRVGQSADGSNYSTVQLKTHVRSRECISRKARCGTFSACGEGSSSLQGCVLCAHLETRRGDSVPAVSTLFYDPGGGGGAAIFAFFPLFFASGWGGLRGVAVPRSCWPASARVWPPRWSPSTGATPTPGEWIRSRPAYCCCSQTPGGLPASLKQ